MKKIIAIAVDCKLQYTVQQINREGAERVQFDFKSIITFHIL